jgi:hypothetical protein
LRAVLLEGELTVRRIDSDTDVVSSPESLPKRQRYHMSSTKELGVAGPWSSKGRKGLKASLFEEIANCSRHLCWYFPWGDNSTTGDVIPSKALLRNGAYRLASTIGGQIQFTQSCP